MQFRSARIFLASLSLLAIACDSGRGGGGGRSNDLALSTVFEDMARPTGDLGQLGCEGLGSGCYTVYAHGDHTLYRIDLQSKRLETVGPFNAPNVLVGSKMEEDVITDLAVAPDDTIWVISNTAIYTASPTDGHVTRRGNLAACGQAGVALTFTPDGKLYTADFKGAFCRIDTSASPPTVTPVASLGSGMAVSGDLVAVADGTMYATAYRLSDASNTGTQLKNLLVKVNPATAAVTTMGSTGYPKLFGVAFAMGQVFGFTHDGTGEVITINPTTGVGTLFNSFPDPASTMGDGIRFAGAGVNSMVSPIN